jgi:metallo-beta-lactamase family protein
VGRTQELLYLIRTIKEQGLVKGHDGFPVYVDSPLAVEATRIYSMGMTEFYDGETLELLSRGIDPIRFPELRLSITADDSKRINADMQPKVILSASGMCEAGRVRHHLKHNLWRKESTVLFVGYQSEGTVGRKLLDGASSVKLFGEPIAVHCNIANLQGISGHADRDMMLGWLEKMGTKPLAVFVNHGENEVTDSFAEAVSRKLGVPAAAPYSGDEYDLATGECTAKGVIAKVSKVSDGRRRANTIFDRLLSAGKRLLKIIEASRDMSNKALEKFADQVDALCDRYEQR